MSHPLLSSSLKEMIYQPFNHCFGSSLPWFQISCDSSSGISSQDVCALGLIMEKQLTVSVGLPLVSSIWSLTLFSPWSLRVLRLWLRLPKSVISCLDGSDEVTWPGTVRCGRGEDQEGGRCALDTISSNLCFHDPHLLVLASSFGALSEKLIGSLFFGTFNL